MGWEARGGGLYYYRSEWRDGRPVKEYVGNGRLADVEARLDAEERQQRIEAAQTQRQARARVAEADALVDLLCRETDILAAAALTVADYHQHDRGAWKKRRWRPK